MCACCRVHSAAVELWLDKQPQSLFFCVHRVEGEKVAWGELRTVWRLWSSGLQERDWTLMSAAVVMMSFCAHHSLPATWDALNHSWPCHHSPQFELESCGTLSARLHKGFVTGWHDDSDCSSRLKTNRRILITSWGHFQSSNTNMFSYTCMVLCLYWQLWPSRMFCSALFCSGRDGILPPAEPRERVERALQAGLESLVIMLTSARCMNKHKSYGRMFFYLSRHWSVLLLAFI